MTRVIAACVCAAGVLASGCGPTAEARPDGVELKAKVTIGGQPVKGVGIMFLPHTGTQAQRRYVTDAAGMVKGLNGSESKIIPGKYSVVFFADKDQSAFKAIPAKFTDDGKPALEVEVPQTGDLTIDVK